MLEGDPLSREKLSPYKRDLNTVKKASQEGAQWQKQRKMQNETKNTTTKVYDYCNVKRTLLERNLSEDFR